MPDKIHAHPRKLPGVPPAVDGPGHCDLPALLFGRREGVLPAAGGDLVVALPSGLGRGVEISHEPHIPFLPQGGCHLGQGLPLAQEGLLLVLPPAHVEAEKPARLRPHRQGLPGLPVFIVPGSGEVELGHLQDGAAGENSRPLIVFVVSQLGRNPTPEAGKIVLRQPDRRPKGVVIPAHPGHGVGTLHVSAGQQFHGGHILPARRLVHLLERHHVRALLKNRLKKYLCLSLTVRLRQTVGVQSQKLHKIHRLIYRISLISDFNTSALGP